MNKTLIAGGAIVIFGIGFELGGSFVRNKMKDTLNEAMPLIGKAITNVLTRAADENLPREEVNRLMAEELEFVKLTMM